MRVGAPKTGGKAQVTTPAAAPPSNPYRYSREQMLAMFKKRDDPPAGLDAFSTIFREMIDIPMAFVPITEGDRVSMRAR